MEQHELTGEARDLYESWRRLGHTEAQALDEVRRSGIGEQQALEDAFRSAGMSEAEAHIAAQGRDGGVRTADPFEQLYNMFLRTGMSEAQARAAAIGRDGTEHQARQQWTENMRQSGSGNGPGRLQESAGGRPINIREVGLPPDVELQETFQGIAANAREIQQRYAGRPGAERVIADAKAIETIAIDLERQAGR